ncbi:hypothetical protein AJ80_06492 [Polytolypa hystricis UAMH7299]|uniref:E3 ubiquitin-protein ligase n=1 Tax=Polytolypa hystricis (strain UAMH7299) TaxID=1447883 RepID=A0A2B7XWS7_POLH7|nr:hypothetical protein AJ80_06492 [Polytolypa hystricis UAMH7299]
MLSDIERKLGAALLEHPSKHGLRYTEEASRDLVELLFHSLTAYSDEYLRMLFPDGPPKGLWKATDAQGAQEGAEYTEAARGKRCGHVFRNGEVCYRCFTCSTDDTCVLCSRCFDASDHRDHKYSISLSSGHSGCCDCGDEEAFRIPVLCGIHTDTPGSTKRKGKESVQLPVDLVDSIRTTIARVFDYFCDVISCSPEQLRLPKTEEGIREDEVASRIAAEWYGGSDPVEEEPEFALVLWNDEKHTITEVANQVTRACRERSRFGMIKADETNEIGRSVVRYSKDLPRLLQVSRIIEQIRVTVTVRSARDTYREQMCGTIIEWLSDIAGCSIGKDTDLLRTTVCEQMLMPWHIGSGASNAYIGKHGIDDHEYEERKPSRAFLMNIGPQFIIDFDSDEGLDDAGDIGGDANENDHEEDEGEEEEEDDEDMDEVDPVRHNLEHIVARIGEAAAHAHNTDVEMGMEVDLPPAEAILGGQPPAGPPPQPAPLVDEGEPAVVPSAGTESEPSSASQLPGQVKIPRTPGTARATPHPRAPPYWEIKPRRYHERGDVPPYEDLRQRTRLDEMILFDLRLWKKTRVDIRGLYLATIVNVPEFKRILGLRFSALYTTLAQLYLIADREPDHSIIHLSLQLLTTPSITEEIVERGNFLTNIMAILYTFLTTRQVGEPHDVDTSGTLATDAGSISNRRLYHFIMDLRYLLPSEHVKSCIRSEPQYLLQFLDLVKLPQGICPNVRAVGEHVEYEADGWIGASLLMREINRLCRLLCDAFRTYKYGEDDADLSAAITAAAMSTMLNSVGLERKRFDQAEIKELVRFKNLPYVEFEMEDNGGFARHRVVDFVVERGTLSFHHALHYTLSWLLECGRSMPSEKMREILVGAAEYARSHFSNTPVQHLDADDIILAMFDFPLRVCAWLAQMKAGMWVRNGLSLRHQMGQYRAVVSRDMAYYRDLFLLQSALVVCNPSRFLATMMDRFGMADWMRGGYETRPGFEESQHIDIAEEFVHLLIILLTDRTALSFADDDEAVQSSIISKDIAHALCFKPLSFTDLSTRIHDKLVEADNFHIILEEVAVFRPPEGMNDSGTFELKPEYLELVDPYCAQYTKNQRDEAENLYRQYMAKKTGKKASDIVFEPKPRPIHSGAFANLSDFTKIPLFAQIIHHCLDYCINSKTCTPGTSITRVEAFLHIVLHLVLLAVMEDITDEDDMAEEPVQSFVMHALHKSKETRLGSMTIIGLLQKISTMSEFDSCAPKIRHILKKFWQKRPKLYSAATVALKFPYDKIEAPSPATNQGSDMELKKKQALDRQARVMAQFQQQQQNFLNAQGTIDWGEDDMSDEEEANVPSPTEKKLWKYPSGTCILCQEDTNDGRIYGTFALMADSMVLRQTELHDPSFVREALKSPSSLDRSAEHIRPFGVAGENRETVRKPDSTGGEVITEKQGLSKGFPPGQAIRGPVTTGCGHIMHYSCFEVYYTATQRRHNHQVARNHPERLALKEFVCPLCKALGNAFLPIIWKGKEECYPGVLDTEVSFDQFLNQSLVQSVSRFRSHSLIVESDKLYTSGYQDVFVDYITKNFISLLSNKVDQLFASVPPESLALGQPPRMTMPGLFPAPEEPTAPSPLHQTASATDTPMTELIAIYRRLRDTMRANGIQSRFGYRPDAVTTDELIYSDALIRSFGFSISSVEIAQRGVAAQPGMTLLDTIPQLSLTHLRVLSETAFSYVSIGGLSNTSTNRTVFEFRDMHRRKLCQLFLGHPQISGLTSLVNENKTIEPLLGLDIFVFLSECSLCLVPVLNLDIRYVVQLCYVAEIIKCVLAFILRPQGLLEEIGLDETDPGDVDYEFTPEYYATRGFFDWVVDEYKSAAPQQASSRTASPDNLIEKKEEVPPSVIKAIQNLAAKYALPFLRKTVILLHVRYGVEFPSTGAEYSDMSELDRLTTLLRLPTIDDIFRLFAIRWEENPMELLACGWIAHWRSFRADTKAEDNRLLAPSLPHPAIFELVGLPKYFDFLLDEATRRRCKTTGKEMTDPSICLFCGDIFCSQAVCCRGSGRLGGCNRHVTRCGRNIGMFINIRKCMVLLLHNQNGIWQHAPYLDIHGEVDPGFRHHRRLILNQKRYDRLLRDVWLAHGIPATISRRLEAEINNGGWETI